MNRTTTAAIIGTTSPLAAVAAMIGTGSPFAGALAFIGTLLVPFAISRPTSSDHTSSSNHPS